MQYDQALQLSVTAWKRDGLLKEGQLTKGAMPWYVEGEAKASVGVAVDLRDHQTPKVIPAGSQVAI